jgi:hypothetical protein
LGAHGGPNDDTFPNVGTRTRAYVLERGYHAIGHSAQTTRDDATVIQ